MQTDYSHLPPTAQKLIALIGLPLTLRLVMEFGGTTINLYNSENSLEGMGAIIGRQAAEKMLKFFGNDPFTVPLCTSALRTLRNKRVLAEFDRITLVEKRSARQAVQQITRLFTPGIHERTIWRILKTDGQVKAPDSRQMGLF